MLFDSIVNARWFSITSIILFLNKTDVFREKLPRSPLARYFPEFTGGDDLQKAAKFILWKFVMMNRARLTIYPQYVSMLIQSYTEAHNVKSLTQTTDLDRVRQTPLESLSSASYRPFCSFDSSSSRSQKPFFTIVYVMSV